MSAAQVQAALPIEDTRFGVDDAIDLAARAVATLEALREDLERLDVQKDRPGWRGACSDGFLAEGHLDDAQRVLRRLCDELAYMRRLGVQP